MAKREETDADRQRCRSTSELAGDRSPTLRRELDAIDREIVAAINRRARSRAADRPAEAGRRRNAFSIRSAKPKSCNKPSANNAGPLSDDAVRAVFRELVSGTRAVQTPTARRLSRARVHVQPPGGDRAIRPIGRAGAGRHDRGRVRRSRARPGRSSASCRWRTPPTAACRTRSIASRDRTCGFAASCRCGFTIACWASARATTCAPSTANRSRCRNVATGWRGICRNADLREVASTAEAAKRAKDDPHVGRGRQRAGRRQLRPAGAGRRTSKTTRTTSRGSPSSRRQRPQRTGNDKTALMFEIAHQPGRWPTRWPSSNATGST